MRDYSTQKVELKGIPNARQLGGYTGADGRKVKMDVLLRTGSLNGAGEDTFKLLEDRYHVSDIVDFRMPQESYVQPEPEVKGAKYHHISVLNDLPATEEDLARFTELMHMPDIGQRYLEIYESPIDVKMFEVYTSVFFGDDGKKGYREFFDILLAKDDKSSVLFHCTQGKDRTGMAAMLILSALGVDKTTILNDYLMTNDARSELLNLIKTEVPKVTDNEEVLQLALYLEGVNKDFVMPLFERTDKEYGGMLGFIKEEIGLSDGEIEDLREIYLE